MAVLPHSVARKAGRASHGSGTGTVPPRLPFSVEASTEGLFMHRLLPAIALTLLVSACGGPAPAPEQPAQPSSAAPAPQQPAAVDDAMLEPVVGTWGLDPAVCDQVIRISKTRFEGAENGCDISGFTDNGDGTLTAAMSCTSQGQTADEQIKMRPVFAPTGEGLELTYLNRDNLQTLLLRCAEPSAAN